jgi:hypothetical protein
MPFCRNSEMIELTAHTFAFLMMSRVVNSPPTCSNFNTLVSLSLFSRRALFMIRRAGLHQSQALVDAQDEPGHLLSLGR